MVGRAGNHVLGRVASALGARHWAFAALALGVGLTGCTAEVDGERTDGVDPSGTSEQALTKPELIASKNVKLWSNLRKARAGAHYVACPKQKFKFTLRFRNKGNVVWRDVAGRGKSVGSDIFLRTLNNRPDPLTGKVHYSVNDDDNDYVRWDRGAGECAVSPGCRQTRFVKHGISAVAPAVPGKVYKSSWQMRDYSSAWDNSQAFGPKITVRVAVVDCGVCSCAATCSDGKTTPMEMTFIHDAASCKDVATVFCTSAKTQFVSSNYNCPGGSSATPVLVGSPGDEDLDSPDPDNSWWIQPDDDGTGGTGGTGGSGSGDPWYTEPDPGIGEQPDDPSALPDNFNGVSEKGGVTPADDAGCFVSTSRPKGSSWGGLGGLVVLLVTRRLRALRTRRARSC